MLTELDQYIHLLSLMPNQSESETMTAVFLQLLNKLFAAMQVMVPGKQNYSLTIAWQLPYDPVAAVNRSLKSIPENEGESPSSKTYLVPSPGSIILSAWPITRKNS